MRIPPFTLIHNRHPGAATRASAAALPKDFLGNLNPRLRQTLLMSAAGGGAGAVDSLRGIANEFDRHDRVESVGVWDLGTWASRLPKLIEVMNGAQSHLVFFELQAALPSGLLSRPERIAAWASEVLGRKLSQQERKEMTAAVIDVEFFDFARPVRGDLGLDYLVAITPQRIAGEVDDQDGHTVHTDFFNSAHTNSRISLVSTCGLRELAAKASRSFEFAVGFVVVGTQMAALNSKVEFHEKNFHADRLPCLFDYNYNRREIVGCLRQPRIGDECLKRIQPGYRSIAQALLKALDRRALSGVVAPRRR